MNNFLRNLGIILACFTAAALILLIVDGTAHAADICFLDDDILICPGKPVTIFID